MQTILLAGVILGILANNGFAEVNFKVKLREYFGQYNSGVADTAAHFESYGEANLAASGTKGNFTGYFEIESRAQNQAFKNTQRRIDYKADFGKVSIGTISNLGTVPFTVGGGSKTSNLPTKPGRHLVHAGWLEAEGVALQIPVGKLNLKFNIHGEAATLVAGGVEGQTIQAGIWGPIGPAQLRASITSVTRDNYAGGDATSDSAMMLGVKVPFGNMAVMFDYASYTETKGDNATDDMKYNDTAIGFSMDKAGPGKFIFTYLMATKKGSIEYQSNNNISLVYDIPLEAGAGFQVLYQSDSTIYSDDQKSANAALEDKTASFTGVGFYLTL